MNCIATEAAANALCVRRDDLQQRRQCVCPVGRLGYNMPAQNMFIYKPYTISLTIIHICIFILYI